MDSPRTGRELLFFPFDPQVTYDVIGNSHSAIFDSLATMVIGGDMAKCVIWYDNGWGYANRVVELITRDRGLQLSAAATA